MGKIIAICNQKGGVGKTTTCVNLSAALGVLENKVLVIDTDPQGNASLSFGVSLRKINNPALENMDYTSVIKNNLVKTTSPNVDLLPFFEDLNFFKRTSRASKFKKALQDIQSLYDYIIIDCVPFFKTKNLDILVTSNSVLIPVQADYYALEGLHQFLKTVRYVQKGANKNLEVEGFLLTMFNKNLNLSKKVANYMHSYFNELVFKTVINRCSKITQAPSLGKSVLEFDISSAGAKDYLDLANEIITKNELAKNTEKELVLAREQDYMFNSKKLSAADISPAKESDLFEKIFNTSISEQKNSKLSIPKNFDALVNLSKDNVKKIMGSPYKNIFGNTWIYKINSSHIFKKKYLHIHFKNNIVINYYTKWFSY